MKILKLLLVAALLTVAAAPAFADYYYCTVTSSTHNYTRTGLTYYEACQYAMSECVHKTPYYDSCNVDNH